MKIIYIANARIPTEKAHGLQIMSTCEALAAQGAEVELLLPRRHNPIKDAPFAYYGIKPTFQIKKLPCLDLVGLIPRLGFLVQAVTFAESAFWYCLFKKADVIYTRDLFSAYNLVCFKKNVYWEAHQGEKSFVARRVVKRAHGIVTITEGLAKIYRKMRAETKFLIAPDGVDLKKFLIHASREEARRKLSLPLDKKLILYSGQLYQWKGVETLAATATEKGLLMQGSTVVIIGGPEKDKDAYEAKFKNDQIKFIGARPHEEIPLYLAAADVLVLPNTAREPISRDFTSPIKLFEYMASGRPIVASDLPSLREVLSERNSFLVKPDDIKALADGINYVLENETEAQRRADQALKDVERYSWEKRAEKIIKFLQ